MALPGTLWERASTALQRLQKLPNLVCLSTLAGLGARVASYITQLRHLFDQCATKHRYKTREQDLQRWAQLVFALLQHHLSLHSASCNTQAYAIAASVTSRLARCTTQ